MPPFGSPEDEGALFGAGDPPKSSTSASNSLNASAPEVGETFRDGGCRGLVPPPADRDGAGRLVGGGAAGRASDPEAPRLDCDTPGEGPRGLTAPVPVICNSLVMDKPRLHPCRTKN